MSGIQAIPCSNWIHPGVAPHAVLLCVHGLGLHGGMYRALGEALGRRGVATYALDVRGFGAWHKDSSCLLNFPQCVEDIRAKLLELKSRHMGLPIFLLGESLGGAIATRFAAKYPELVDGLIISEPAKGISHHKVMVLQVALSYFRNPRARINLSSIIARSVPRLVAAQNSLNHSSDTIIRLQFTVGELLHMSKFMSEAFKSAKDVRTPVLMLQGHGDQLISTRSTVAFFERLGVKDKDMVVLGDADHLIFQTNEVAPKVLSLVTDWITERSEVNERLRAV